jgi:hypothetical protein
VVVSHQGQLDLSLQLWVEGALCGCNFVVVVEKVLVELLVGLQRLVVCGVFNSIHPAANVASLCVTPPD